jgi:hypothetical protein
MATYWCLNRTCVESRAFFRDAAALDAHIDSAHAAIAPLEENGKRRKQSSVEGGADGDRCAGF